MSGGNEKVTFTLKAFLNRDESKVLFVEADNHFVDVVLSFLTMPLGKIVRLLQKHYGDDAPVIGSLTSLYKGLENLGSVHFRTEVGKEMLLNPRNSSANQCRELKINVDDEPTKYFKCGSCGSSTCITMYGDICGNCGRKNCVEVPLIEPQANASGDAGVFTTHTASFVVFDDLRIMHNSIAILDCFSSIEMEEAKLREVSFGFNEIMDLLKGSLLSTTPLSDIILKDRSSAAAAKPESRVLFAPFVDEAVSETKKIALKVMIQKSTNKVLFRQAEEDLVDFLFSLLAIPLGGVASLLQGNTSLTNIDNLYNGVANSIPDKYLITPDMKDRLIQPKLGLHYLSSHQILPLNEETHPPLYFNREGGKSYLYLVDPFFFYARVDSFKSPRCHADYVKGPTTHMVTDDLVITQFSIASSISIIKRLNIPMSDVKQVDLIVGVPEGLRILKASLTSNSVLTDALLKPMVKKKPKQEN